MQNLEKALPFYVEQLFQIVNWLDKFEREYNSMRTYFRFDILLKDIFCTLTSGDISEELPIIPVPLNAVEIVPHHLVVAGEGHRLPNFCAENTTALFFQHSQA